METCHLLSSTSMKNLSLHILKRIFVDIENYVLWSVQTLWALSFKAYMKWVGFFLKILFVAVRGSKPLELDNKAIYFSFCSYICTLNHKMYEWLHLYPYISPILPLNFLPFSQLLNFICLNHHSIKLYSYVCFRNSNATESNKTHACKILTKYAELSIEVWDLWIWKSERFISFQVGISFIFFRNGTEHVAD